MTLFGSQLWTKLPPKAKSELTVEGCPRKAIVHSRGMLLTDDHGKMVHCLSVSESDKIMWKIIFCAQIYQLIFIFVANQFRMRAFMSCLCFFLYSLSRFLQHIFGYFVLLLAVY